MLTNKNYIKVYNNFIKYFNISNKLFDKISYNGVDYRYEDICPNTPIIVFSIYWDKVETTFPSTPERDAILDFIKTSKTGIIKRPSKTVSDEDKSF